MPFLTSEQRAAFDRDGYLIVHDLFDPVRDLAPVIAEYEMVLDRLATELHDAGEIAERYADLPFAERLTQVYRESGRAHAQYFDFALPQSGVTHETPFWTGPAVFALLRHEGLLDAVESLIGGEIYSNPVQHVRLKPPERLVPKNANGSAQVAATPWHQDNGVVTEDADATEIVTVWFPLTEVTVENGCLVVVPGSHRGELLAHCPAHGGLKVPDHLFHPEAGVPVPLKPGAAIFMHRRTLHSSLPNESDTVRWSFDLRYNPVGQPTGRAAMPGFVARSRSAPETELRDGAIWTELWREARRALAKGEPPRFNRWDANALACA